ncbi:hypothetical protein [Kitasatospora purpeofusca]|uniref:hypothetical protein n=1 Tax=Kitasatospora purpeofusca TaxID=67352 RepID=UPI002A5A6F87|nr:hypothetical protein [Kitasatospora purpeofusca]MDY0814118.1 hypothetical protein [Kitasatospora purpeofusca]
MSSTAGRLGLRARQVAAPATALLLSAGTMFGATAPALASAADPTVSTHMLPMTVSDGWVTYTNAVAPTLGLDGLKTVTLNGSTYGIGMSEDESFYNNDFQQLRDRRHRRPGLALAGRRSHASPVRGRQMALAGWEASTEDLFARAEFELYPRAAALSVAIFYRRA